MIKDQIEKDWLRVAQAEVEAAGQQIAAAKAEEARQEALQREVDEANAAGNIFLAALDKEIERVKFKKLNQNRGATQ